ncbi:uncharacterized protein BXZ73DRAFT_55771 [Epithele typhae]|uniref:uncharacterized protein n=1 Tax=Epithele typhae TaxID=378194 RepID=UPI0020084C6F|nr:uncharacterized protein BXZ73DRAFT_55771 [Epithele typhae]KAH9912987.1 hypothetical protein BXZ73DRAFT_55771 [Epithele typhae]
MATLPSLVMTSPNQDWIPAHPVERAIIRTYTDGLWGELEYSRWPQPMIRNMWHIACIPSPLRPPPDSPPVLWTTLAPSQHWREDPSVGVPGLGFLEHGLRQQLREAACFAFTRYQSIVGVPPHRLAYGDQLCVVIRQCVERMNRLPSYAPVAVAVGAHIQRVALELMGLHMYLTTVLSRMDSPNDFSLQVLPVLGVIARDAATAQLAHRVGLPTWFLQPLTTRIKVWAVVEATTPFALSRKESSPPMRHHPEELGAVANLTSNWTSNLVFAVTGQLCAGSLAPLDDGTTPLLGPSLTGSGEGPLKTRRIEMAPIPSQAPSTSQPGGVKKKTRREHRHPARVHNRSVFVDIPEAWSVALLSQGPLPQPRTSVVYFYPPPFLLDTKVHRYLHNAVRIRAFCRLRLLDLSLSGGPLTIAEWRAALWGDYAFHPDPSVPAAAQKRVKRKVDEKNSVSRLFGNGAALPSYSAAQVVRLEGLSVSAEDAAINPTVRARLLWEAHEINFRCELMALDAVLVPRSGWSVMQRWGREMLVSGVWGKESSIATVIPLPSDDVFAWPSVPQEDWRSAEPYLRRFMAVASAWPGCPDHLKSGRLQEDWTVDMFETFQVDAVAFYVSQFTRRFGRLPIPPVRRPLHAL